jgi:signal transduction histidine kinase
LVEYIRSELGNRRIRIILRTGQAGFAPEYRVVQNYDINDYLAKSESTQERLFVSLTTALRGYRDVVAADVYARRALEAEQEREVAARALESKTQFLAHLSHEIRNPLTGLVGIVELLESESLSPNQIELVGDLEYTVQSLLGVVDDVLDVAKIEAGRLQLHHEAFNARLWLQRSSAVLAANIRRKGITLTSECVEGVPEYLVGDASRMRQILVNFLSNACKFTPEGGRIHVQLNAESRRDKFILHLSVSDSGVGIDSSKLADVFQPYEQASGLTALEYGGTGLGLNLCQNLAELMKGQVGVISQPNRGSIFGLMCQWM